MSLWLWLSAAVVAALLVLVLLAWLVVRGQGPEAKALGLRIWRLPWRAKGRLARDLVGDPRAPLWARALIPALVVYVALPIDIIPDFIPVLGHLDDVAVLVVAGAALLRAVPRAVLEDHVRKLEATGKLKAYRRHPP